MTVLDMILLIFAFRELVEVVFCDGFPDVFMVIFCLSCKTALTVIGLQ